MIVADSDVLLAALDRRLLIDRVSALDALTPLATGDGRESGAAPAPSAPLPSNAGPAATPANASPASPGASAADAADAELIEHLPLGQVVAGRVVDVPGPRQLIAEVGPLRIALAWPGGNGPSPVPGSEIALRVLAHSPMLLFENLHAFVAASVDPDEATTRLSPSALQLQTPGAAGNSVRFSAPILKLEFAATDKPSARPTSAEGAVSASIALEDVIVGAGAHLVDSTIGNPVAPPATTLDATTNPAITMPLVLQGPAWIGQEFELIVRRDRADEAFENAALDQWCGELVIDLPQLGRVAGHLAWSMQGLRIRLEGQGDASVASMSAAATELAAGLAEVDLPVLSLSIGQLLADTVRTRGSASMVTP